MDKKIVGVNAGKVWQALNEVTEISIVELAEKLNLSVESTAGWLAREDQISIERKNGTIELQRKNAYTFNFG